MLNVWDGSRYRWILVFPSILNNYRTAIGRNNTASRHSKEKRWWHFCRCPNFDSPLPPCGCTDRYVREAWIWVLMDSLFNQVEDEWTFNILSTRSNICHRNTRVNILCSIRSEATLTSWERNGMIWAQMALRRLTISAWNGQRDNRRKSGIQDGVWYCNIISPLSTGNTVDPHGTFSPCCIKAGF